MSAIWFRARAELRHRWVAALVVAVLAGMAGGVVIASVAGARRTSSAMDRFLASYRPWTGFLEFGESGLDPEAVADLPMVASTGTGSYVLMAPSLPDGSPDTDGVGRVNPFLVVQGSGEPSERQLVAEGRLPDWDSEPLEVAIDTDLAAQRDLGPGDTLRMWAFAPEQLEDVATGGIGVPEGEALDFEVTAVVRTPADVRLGQGNQDVVYLGVADLYLGRAWYERYGGQVASFGGPEEGLAVRLDEGEDDVTAFTEALAALPGGEDAVFETGSEAVAATEASRDAIDVQASTLYAFAAVAAVAGLLIVGQALARQVAIERADHPGLRASGMTTAQLVGIALVRALVVAVAATILAVTSAVALSSLFPIGLARAAEIDPGPSLDLPVLLLGGPVLALVLLLTAAVAAVRAARRATAGPPRSSRAADRLARMGAPAPAVTGVRLALEAGAGRTATPVRGAIVGAALGAGAVVAAVGFGASLSHLTGTPELHGWGWDVAVGDADLGSIEEEGTALLAANPNVERFAAHAASLGDASVDGVDVGVVEGLGYGDGGPHLPVVEGRAPAAPDEVALGTKTLDASGADIGDSVEVAIPEGTGRFTVVGTALFSTDEEAGIARGAVLTLPGLQSLGIEPLVDRFVVDYADGVDEELAYRSLREDFGRTVLRPLLPASVENLRSVRGMPVALAALIGLLAVGTLGHALVTSVRRRRSDLAVLRTFGFVGRQLSATVAWQATTVVALALVLGVPLGVAVGRWTWEIVADGVGTPASAVVPLAGVLLALPATLAVANLIAALPARAAARTQPAVVLRSE